MTLGVSGTGPYGKIRGIRDQLKMDREYLANAPLSPKKRKELERVIELQRSELKRANNELRRYKAARGLK